MKAKRCLFCYDPSEDYMTELVEGRSLKSYLEPVYTICDQCLEKHFPYMTKEEAIKMLKNGIWVGDVCYKIGQLLLR